MMWDATERVREAREYYDSLLENKLNRISELSGVSRDKFVPIKPCDFIEHCAKTHYIAGYKYQQIGAWIRRTKEQGNYLISPVDADEETAAQIAYKEHIVSCKVRASKCEVLPIPGEIARQFYIKNHRQSIPAVTTNSISFGLVSGSQILSCMTYDICDGAVRGHKNRHYELLRLAIAHGYQIQGGGQVGFRSIARMPCANLESRKYTPTQTQQSTTGMSIGNLASRAAKLNRDSRLS